MKKIFPILLLSSIMLCSCNDESVFDYKLYQTVLNRMFASNNFGTYKGSNFEIEGTYKNMSSDDSKKEIAFTIKSPTQAMFDVRLLAMDKTVTTSDSRAFASVGFTLSEPIILTNSTTETYNSKYYCRNKLTLYWYSELSDIESKVYFSYVVNNERIEYYFNFSNFTLA